MYSQDTASVTKISGSLSGSLQHRVTLVTTKNRAEATPWKNSQAHTECRDSSPTRKAKPTLPRTWRATVLCCFSCPAIVTVEPRLMTEESPATYAGWGRSAFPSSDWGPASAFVLLSTLPCTILGPSLSPSKTQDWWPLPLHLLRKSAVGITKDFIFLNVFRYLGVSVMNGLELSSDWLG